MKSELQPFFRSAFSQMFNFDSEGYFRYQNPIGNVPSRPLGTKYENSSFAYIHRNTLFVTVDQFYQESSDKVIGNLGTVTGAVVGNHLQWFDNILASAQNIAHVKHILVQGHLPVLSPVRKIKSSGMMMENGTKSDFWKSMQKHNVDIYFAGEVHDNTVTVDSDSNLIQVIRYTYDITPYVKRSTHALNFVIETF